MYYNGNHMGAGGWVFMAIIMVVLLGLLVAFIVWLVGDQRRRPHHEGAMTGRPAPVTGSASEILDRRLATGEISIEEYERLKASLATPARVPSAAEPPTAPQS
jgi:uncharacterized membrane protein